MKTSKIIASEVKNNTVVYVEYRYDEMAICTGLFLVTEKNGKILEEEEMPFESTAMAIMKSRLA